MKFSMNIIVSRNKDNKEMIDVSIEKKTGKGMTKYEETFAASLYFAITETVREVLSKMEKKKPA